MKNKTKIIIASIALLAVGLFISAHFWNKNKRAKELEYRFEIMHWNE